MGARPLTTEFEQTTVVTKNTGEIFPFIAGYLMTIESLYSEFRSQN